MQMKIAERLRPYSHTPGVYCILPGSCYQLQIFPCLIRIYDLSQAKSSLLAELILDLEGPIQDFTVLNDLEKGWVRVWGHTTRGYIRYHLTSQDLGQGIGFCVEKTPEKGLNVALRQGAWHLYAEQRADPLIEIQLKAKDEIVLASALPSFNPYQPPKVDRLSLGNQKAQDWDLVQRRLDLTEIFPSWNRLGQLVSQPAMPFNSYAGTAALLQTCQELMVQRKPELLVPAFTSLFQAGFHGILAPRLFDDQYQGLISAEKATVPSSLSPLILLTEGSRLLRHLFIQQQGKDIAILPILPPQFHCGRWLQVTMKGGILDMEWTKKIIRQILFYSQIDQDLIFHFKHPLKSFRLRTGEKEKGHRVACGSSLFMKKDCFYLFDNFM